ncbi:hypothetical protein Tco_0839569 [Tanacetum coccineum]|uniref:Uncharacterized protein n=1 Tax=Tanacetum coccineum TaxID=301880 RepID=A0ABQ5ATS6_9ASTR
MDNPNITIEEYIRIQEEKALSQGETFNWQTATYGKMEYYKDEDRHAVTKHELNFAAIVLDNTLTSDPTLSCGPTVSPLNNNEIDFTILFDESADEDYTVVYHENSFSYKIIYVNNLKTDSENDNDKVNMPSFPSPEPKVRIYQKSQENSQKNEQARTRESEEYKKKPKNQSRSQEKSNPQSKWSNHGQQKAPKQDGKEKSVISSDLTSSHSRGDTVTAWQSSSVHNDPTANIQDPMIAMIGWQRLKDWQRLKGPRSFSLSL